MAQWLKAPGTQYGGGAQIPRTHVKSTEQLLKPLVVLALRRQSLGLTRATWLAKTV